MEHTENREAPFVETLKRSVKIENPTLIFAYRRGLYDCGEFGNNGVRVRVLGYEPSSLPSGRVRYRRVEWERTEVIDDEHVLVTNESGEEGIRIQKQRDSVPESEAPESWQYIDD